MIEPPFIDRLRFAPPADQDYVKSVYQKAPGFLARSYVFFYSSCHDLGPFITRLEGKKLSASALLLVDFGQLKIVFLSRWETSCRSF
jgi:hypothetical protein